MVSIKTEEEIKLMKESCRIAASTLDMIKEHIKPGITTIELNRICHEYILSHNCYPSPYRYNKSNPFPKSVCTSLNNVICHGIPTAKQKLRNGDILNIDVTVYKGDFTAEDIKKFIKENPGDYFPEHFKGFHGDTNRTYLVGKVKPEVKKLVEDTHEAMMQGISVVKPGARLGDIGNAIQTYAEKLNYSVVRDFTGHGIGRQFHEDPSVLHYGKKGTGMALKKGMTFTVEPMINLGHYDAKILKDGWTAVTSDGSLSAQFEHTIVVTDDGYEIMTLAK